MYEPGETDSTTRAPQLPYFARRLNGLGGRRGCAVAATPAWAAQRLCVRACMRVCECAVSRNWWRQEGVVVDDHCRGARRGPLRITPPHRRQPRVAPLRAMSIGPCGGLACGRSASACACWQEQLHNTRSLGGSIPTSMLFHRIPNGARCDVVREGPSAGCLSQRKSNENTGPSAYLSYSLGLHLCWPRMRRAAAAGFGQATPVGEAAALYIPSMPSCLNRGCESRACDYV